MRLKAFFLLSLSIMFLILLNFERILSRLATMAEKAVEMLYELAMNAESESVRLTALRDVLDRAGFKPTDKLEQKNEHSEKIEFSFCDPAAADA